MNPNASRGLIGRVVLRGDVNGLQHDVAGNTQSADVSHFRRMEGTEDLPSLTADRTAWASPRKAPRLLWWFGERTSQQMPRATPVDSNEPECALWFARDITTVLKAPLESGKVCMTPFRGFAGSTVGSSRASLTNWPGLSPKWPKLCTASSPMVVVETSDPKEPEAAVATSLSTNSRERSASSRRESAANMTSSLRTLVGSSTLVAQYPLTKS